MIKVGSIVKVYDRISPEESYTGVVKKIDDDGFVYVFADEISLNVHPDPDIGYYSDILHASEDWIVEVSDPY